MNILTINILVPFICLASGYIFGSIPVAVWVGKIFFHQDPREYGSHNAGGTNAGRLWGKKVGLLIIILDMIKTVAPLYIFWALLTFIKFDYSGIKDASYYGMLPLIADVKTFYTPANELYAIQWPVYWLVPLGIMIGHCWPVFAKFKGGKAASNFMGITLMSSWLLGFLPGFIYLGTLKAKKMVSLAAIVQSICVPILTWIWAILIMIPDFIPADLKCLPMYGPSLNPNWVYATTVTIMGAVTIWRHHENIARIRAGTERKITWMK